MEPDSEIDHFFNLFQTAFKILRANLRIGDDEFREVITRIIQSFHRAPSNAYEPQYFTRDVDYLGHFYRFSTLSASITRHRILEALEDCPDFRLLFDQECLNIVNVGGGSSSDIVGLYSAVYENNSFKAMKITIMEKYGGWAPYSEVVGELLNQGDFGNASELRKSKRIACSFINADMTNITEECAKAFGEADIVWMKAFTSTLQNNWDRIRVTNNIKSYMPKGSFLVVMLTPTYFQYIQLDGLELYFSTDFGAYSFTPPFEPEFNISKQSKQELRIYRKIG